jgi:hypothetical protein
MKAKPLPQKIRAPAPPIARLSLGIVGHRMDNPVFAANKARIETSLREVLVGDGGRYAYESQP